MIHNEKEYKVVSQKIEALLQKATAKGGFDGLTAAERKTLDDFSKEVNEYERTHYFIEIPKTIEGILELKMFEKKMKQRDMAKLLGVTETKLSAIIHQKSKPNINFLKAMRKVLEVDGDILLEAVR